MTHSTLPLEQELDRHWKLFKGLEDNLLRRMTNLEEIRVVYLDPEDPHDYDGMHTDFSDTLSAKFIPRQITQPQVDAADLLLTIGGNGRATLSSQTSKNRVSGSDRHPTPCIFARLIDALESPKTKHGLLQNKKKKDATKLSRCSGKRHVAKRLVLTIGGQTRGGDDPLDWTCLGLEARVSVVV